MRPEKTVAYFMVGSNDPSEEVAKEANEQYNCVSEVIATTTARLMQMGCSHRVVICALLGSLSPLLMVTGISRGVADELIEAGLNMSYALRKKEKVE